MSIEVPDLGYQSHLAVLAAVLRRVHPSSHGIYLVELGCGHGSTHLSHFMAAVRRVLSADTDEKWLATFGFYAGELHKFHLVKAEVPKGSSGVNEYIKAWLAFVVAIGRFDVAFVDCWPGEARVPIIQTLKGKAVAIVAHDLEADEPPGGGNYGWKKLDGLFTYHRVFKRLRPWTGFWSDDFDMPELES